MNVQKEFKGNVECDLWYQLVPLLQAGAIIIRPITKFSHCEH